MFTILGGDGKEYGPVTVAQIRTWMLAGRANLDTQARAVGTEQWLRLGDFPEFSPVPLPPRTVEAPYTPPPPPGAPAMPLPFSPAGTAPKLAGQGARIGAAFINLAVYFFSMLPGGVVAARRMVREFPEMAQGKFISPDRIRELDPAVVIELAAWVYGGVVLAVLLQALLIAVRGQNLGKLLVGVRVTRVDGSSAGFLRGALLRFLFPVVLLFVLMSVPYVGPLFALGFLVMDLCFMFREDRRCLHDLVAGTIVVNK